MTNAAILRRLMGLAKPRRGWMMLGGIAACVTAMASLGLMAVAGWFIAAMAIAGVTTGMMNYFLPAAGIRFFAILRTGGRYAERLLSHEATFRLLADLRLWLFRRLEPLAPAGLEDRRGADLASGLQADVDTLQHAYLRLGAPLPVALVCAALATSLLVALHPPSGAAVALLLLTGGALIPIGASRAAANPGAEVVRLRGELRVAVADALQGATDLRAAGAMTRHLAAARDIGDRLAAAQRRAALPGALAEAALSLCAGLALWIAALLSGSAVAASTLAPALAPALALAAFASFEALAPLPAAAMRWGEVAAAGRRIFALADREPILVEDPDAPASPVPEDTSLDFRDVRLRYAPDGAPALDGFSLAVRPGGRVALLGPSGAGKSSIAAILQRFRDYEGEVRLGGHDLRRYRADDLRRMVGVAGQSPQFLNGTLRDNLALAAPGASEADMWQALEIAQLGAFVRDLPGSLDAWIGEGGARLSAGQARRLVLARTLLRKPTILILDEPTENLDPDTARALLSAVAAETQGLTTLLITHDPATAEAFADEILHLEAGRVAEQPRRHHSPRSD